MSGTPPAEGQSNIHLDDDYLLSTTFKLSDFGAGNQCTAARLMLSFFFFFFFQQI